MSEKYYEEYKDSDVVGMANKTPIRSFGTTIGTQGNKIYAKNAKTDCCNAKVLKYNDGCGQHWPVCNKCRSACRNGIAKLSNK